ncbi:glycosyltransferase family 25 protein [Moraxella sp. ZY210820]|uniref:glycosyltransferase family 25 protein n=1 Tax=unclassified Moraxella TaxID=2685852 RepID=UPI00272FCB26|nr:glycosyltransferase family 25 protein [Moraxella sp. ZY210820]WLF83015.1 glycosyltransferase family 25 protein [Moraxella sp. ZY210820]
MNNYVISLVASIERRWHIEQEFGKQGIQFQFFDAITPSTMLDVIDKFNINIENVSLTQGEIACLLSHVCLWQKAVDEQQKYIAIFEDDIYLGQNAHLFLNESNWILPQCHIIRLEVFNPCVKMSNDNIDVFDNRKLRQLQDISWGTAGYILSLDGAKSILDYIKQMKKITIADNLLFGHYPFNSHIQPSELKIIYQLSPALCIQGQNVIHNGVNIDVSTLFKSEIYTDISALPNAEQRNFFSLKTKRTLKEKIIREINKLFPKQKHKYTVDKIGFK